MGHTSGPEGSLVQLALVQQTAGVGGAALAVLAVIAVPVWVVFTALTHLGWRIPGALWWLPPTFALGTGALLGWATTLGAPDLLLAAEPLALRDLAVDILSRHSVPRALGFGWMAGWCVASCFGVAVGSSASLEYPKNYWVAAALPVGAGLAGLVLATALGLLLGTPILALLSLIAATGIGMIAIALMAARNTLSQSERARHDGARILTTSFAVIAPLALGAAWAGLGVGALPTAGMFALAVAASGLPALGTTHTAVLDPRSAASILSFALLWTVDGSVLLLTSPSALVRQAAAGGAVARVPDTLWTRLPRTLDLADEEPPGQALDASCLISEHSLGWQAEPLYAALPPTEWIRRTVPDPEAAHELDRNPGCPATARLLEGPLATTEIPVMALDSTRAAMALSGHSWFRAEGELLVLVQPDPVATADIPAAVLRNDAKGVPFHWELPPRLKPPEDHVPGAWDEAWARQLPLTLLEGPYPVLIADGQPMRLPPGAVGAERLQLILSTRPNHERDLVLVPRKFWTVQDIVSFCTSIRSVEDARCVIRPETPIKWSLRTALPLPW